MGRIHGMRRNDVVGDLKRIMKKKGYNYKTLAEATGLSYYIIHGRFNRRAEMTLSELDTISDALGIYLSLKDIKKPYEPKYAPKSHFTAMDRRLPDIGKLVWLTDRKETIFPAMRQTLLKDSDQWAWYIAKDSNFRLLNGRIITNLEQAFGLDTEGMYWAYFQIIPRYLRADDEE